MASDHALCLAVLACQAAQFRRQVKHAKNLQLRSAEERVGCYLLRLAETAPPGSPARLPLEKRQIASAAWHDARNVLAHAWRGCAATDCASKATSSSSMTRSPPMPASSLDPLIDGAEPIQPLATKGTER